MNGKSLATNEDNHELATDDDKLDANEPPILEDALKDIEAVVEASCAGKCQHEPDRNYAIDLLILIEDLHPDKGIEYQGLQLILLAFSLVGQHTFAGKIEDESHDQLVNRLPNNHFPHCERNKRC